MVNLDIAHIAWGRYRYNARVHFCDGTHAHFHSARQFRTFYWHVDRLAYKNCAIFACHNRPQVGLDPQADFNALNGQGTRK